MSDTQHESYATFSCRNNINELRKYTPDQQLIAVSGEATSATRARLESMGVHNFLQKPVSLDALTSAVGLCFEMWGRTQGQQLSYNTAAGRNGHSFLLADDNEELVYGLAETLRALGHTVEVAIDGREACRMALAGRFDVVVLDMSMPRMSGLDALPVLRKSCPGARLIAVSGEASREEIQDMMHRGAHRFIPKPFGVDELLAAVARIRPLVVVSHHDAVSGHDQGARRSVRVPFAPVFLAMVSLLLVILFAANTDPRENGVWPGGAAKYSTADTLSESIADSRPHVWMKGHEAAEPGRSATSKDKAPRGPHTAAAQIPRRLR